MGRVEYNTFENVEIYEAKNKINLKDILFNISFKDLLINIIAFMVSRVVLFTNLLPLSIAYYASGLHSKANRIWLLLFSCAGIVSVKENVATLKYIFILVLIMISVNYFEGKRYKQTKIGQAIIAMIFTFLVGMLFAIVEGFAGYYLVVAILESIIVLQLLIYTVLGYLLLLVI